MTERQELYCHNCDKYVQFDIDPSLDGQHIIHCPNCKHEHYRYVNDGIVSDRRWGSANRPMVRYVSANATYTSSSTTNADTNGNIFLTGSWLNTTTNSSTGTW